MTITDCLAKSAANCTLATHNYLFPLFVSRSAALTKFETMALKEWHDFLNNLKDNNKKIFHSQSSFLPFARMRKPSAFVRL